MTLMSLRNSEQQLELFSGGTQSSAPQRPGIGGRWFLQLGYDQLILTGIGCLIGIAIIFACGVERGKQLARVEDMSTVRQISLAEATQSAVRSSTATALTASKQFEGKKDGGIETPKTKSSNKATLTGIARYAIQVVSYSRLQLARQELQRLQARGEHAFLVTQEGRMVVCVGPFPSQSHAHQKLVTLKARYQDCFIKTL